MNILLQILSFFLLVEGGFLILNGTYKIPPARAQNGLKISTKKKGLMEKVSDEILNPLVKILAPFIIISEEKEAKLKHSLDRASINYTPKEYYARAIVITLFSLLLPMFLIIVGFKAMVPIGFIETVLLSYKQFTSYKSSIKKKKEATEMVLPGFIRSILYKLNDSKSGIIKADLISIFEDYLKVANPVFAWDISILILEMKAKDMEVALRSFNNRLGIPEVGFLCNALIGLTRGEYQHETLAALAREMDIKSKENIKRELEKRPRKVMIACLPLIFIGFISMIYVVITVLNGGIASFK